MLQFATSNPGYTFLIAWALLHYGSTVAVTFWRRLTSLVRVAIRGWPPAHLDADGDWRPVAKDSPDA